MSVEGHDRGEANLDASAGVGAAVDGRQDDGERQRLSELLPEGGWRNEALNWGRRLHRLRRPGVLLLTLAILGAAYAWRFDRWVTSLRFFEAAHSEGFAEQEFPCLTDDELVQLGAAHAENEHPASSYVAHAEEKAPGVIRVGVFGCSFVWGEEAAPSYDVPSLLEHELEAAGVGRVEVLNFGVSGYGLHQAFLLWEALHERFALDYTIFILMGFHAERDTTFIMLDDIYAPVHARYVVENGRIRLVRVAGQDRLEACESYFSLVPRWRSLRYDLKAPPGLRALLPAGRSLRNPFYYHDDAEAEAAELNRLIVGDLRRRASNLLVLCDGGRSLRALRQLPGADDFVARSESLRFARRGKDLYLAPRNHLSGIGNQAMARELVTLLTGGTKLQVPTIVYLREARRHRPALPAEPLHRYDDVWLSSDGKPVGVLVTSDGGEKADLRKLRAASLVDVSSRHRLAFLPIPDRLVDRAPIRVRIESSAGCQTLTIGELAADTPVLGRLEARADGGQGAGAWSVDWDPGRSPLRLGVAGPSPVHTVELLIGARPILRGAPGDEDGGRPLGTVAVRLEPIEGPLLEARGHPAQALRALQPPGGTIQLSLARAHEPPIHFPAREFRMTETRLRDVRTSIADPLSRRGP